LKFSLNASEVTPVTPVTPVAAGRKESGSTAPARPTDMLCLPGSDDGDIKRVFIGPNSLWVAKILAILNAILSFCELPQKSGIDGGHSAAGGSSGRGPLTKPPPTVSLNS